MQTKNVKGQTLINEDFLSELGRLGVINPIIHFMNNDSDFSSNDFLGYFKNIPLEDVHTQSAKVAVNRWLSFAMNSPEAQDRLAKIGLDNDESVLSDWSGFKNAA